MATVREVRRALARGDAEAALMLAWNALEPLRLKGDLGGLRTVGQVAEYIVEHGDSSQAREAERLVREVQEALDSDRSDEPHASFGPTDTVVVDTRRAGGAPQRPDVTEIEMGELEMPEFDGQVEEEEAPGPRIPPLVWAAIIAAFVIFNVVSGLLRE